SDALDAKVRMVLHAKRQRAHERRARELVLPIGLRALAARRSVLQTEPRQEAIRYGLEAAPRVAAHLLCVDLDPGHVELGRLLLVDGVRMEDLDRGDADVPGADERKVDDAARAKAPLGLGAANLGGHALLASFVARLRGAAANEDGRCGPRFFPLADALLEEL